VVTLEICSISKVTTSHPRARFAASRESSHPASIYPSTTNRAAHAGSGSSTRMRYPIERAAIAVIRPSCPPPKIPIVAPGRRGFATAAEEVLTRQPHRRQPAPALHLAEPHAMPPASPATPHPSWPKSQQPATPHWPRQPHQ